MIFSHYWRSDQHRIYNYQHSLYNVDRTLCCAAFVSSNEWDLVLLGELVELSIWIRARIALAWLSKRHHLIRKTISNKVKRWNWNCNLRFWCRTIWLLIITQSNTTRTNIDTRPDAMSHAISSKNRCRHCAVRRHVEHFDEDLTHPLAIVFGTERVFADYCRMLLRNYTQFVVKCMVNDVFECFPVLHHA